MDYRLRNQWFRRSDEKWRVSLPKPTFVLLENWKLGAVPRIRVRQLRIQSPDLSGLCGVSEWPSNAGGSRYGPLSRSALPGPCQRFRKLSRSWTAARPRDD